MEVVDRRVVRKGIFVLSVAAIQNAADLAVSLRVVQSAVFQIVRDPTSVNENRTWFSAAV